MTEAATNDVIEAPEIQLENLERSVAARCEQAKVAFIGFAIALGPIFAALWNTVSWDKLLIWYGPVTLILLWRRLLGVSFLRIEDPDEGQFRRADWLFRANSIVNQIWVGSGVWWVAPYGDAFSPYFVTISIVLWAAGALVSLAYDYRSVVVTMPLLFGQPIAYWAVQGGNGYAIAVSLFFVMYMVIRAGRQIRDIQMESVALRHEKDALNQHLETEKEAADEAKRRAERARARAEDLQRDAEEANRSKSEFLAAASHDLRHPLYAIKLLNERLAMPGLAADKASEIIAEQWNDLITLEEMFDQLLDVSRLESGKVVPKLQDVPLEAFLRNCVDKVQPMCADKDLKVDLHCPDVHVSSDPTLLERVVLNLLTNAVMYTDEGRISVNAKKDGGRVAVTIADTGIGIPEAELGRVRQKFVQLKNPERDRTKGSGLGLSIVDHISELMNLEFHMSSTLGRGTDVSVVLPVVTDPVPEQELTTRKSGPELRKQVYVWIVEDDPMVRSALGGFSRTIDSSSTSRNRSRNSRPYRHTRGGPTLRSSTTCSAAQRRAST